MVRKNAIEIYSAHKEGTSVVAKRFIQILKNKIYKYMTSISKDIYIDELDDIANKGNNIYHRTIKMKPVDAKSNKYINSSREINDKDPRFKIGDIVRILKYQKKNFQKAIFQIGLKMFLSLQMLEILFRGHMFLVILKGKKLFEQKVTKRKDHGLYVKWKGYNSSLNSWIDKKEIV